ncbi:hypothetical protein DYB38_007007 [Aphanomyces astaci]|uniref:Uncharacterized protein n=1 Tax=Aphanomyces astaci TaxID=112090 RepID=A0A397DHL4_APHAT|nr:hypothetical protein DYB38_007007 [Aphanomyces astaci]
MDTTDGALLPVHVRIFQGLVPQVASQATSLENILRTLCQKIETLESCLASINSGVVEMDMRLKIIAHNIEGGTNDEAFNAASTFMPSLASPLPATKPSKSAVVSHVMSALAMGHVAKPLEKPKKRRKKPPPALSSPAGLVTSIPTAELSAGPTEKPPTLNRGHSSARLLRDSPRSRYIPDQRDAPHTARSKANVHAHRHTITAAIDPSPVNLLSQEKWPTQEDAESSDESSDSVDEEVQPSEEELQRLKEAGQHGWKVVRSKLATIKRPKILKITDDKAEMHLVVQFSHRIRDLEENDLVAQLQANQAAVDDMRRLLRKKADVKVLKGSSLEESMMLKPKDPMDQQQQQQPCAARCMSCMKDILVDLPGGDPENDVADAHDLVHNGLTRKVNIGQFASKVPETI